MSELLVDFITSLDGCASGEGWPGFWGLEMIRHCTFDGSIQLVEYRPHVLDHPPLGTPA